MNDKISVIYRKIKELEEELEEEITRTGERLHYRIEEKRILFEQSVLEYHWKIKKAWYRYVMDASLPSLLVAPIIYSLIVPLVLMDVAATIYQFICFPVYGIKKVPRADFIVMDRHHLGYLNFLEKLNCTYCGYANGLAGFVREIAARNEQYWCPIKHARRVRNPHSRYDRFVEYGDADEYRERMKTFERNK